MKSDLLEVIKEKSSTLSKRQRIIGRYICEHYDKAAYMTATKLAESSGVSESTVVRFAFTLGFDGFPELQKALRELIRTRLTSIQRIEITNDRIGSGSVLSSVIGSDIEKLKTTLGQIDGEAFENAVKALIGADNIYIIGARSSSILVQFFGFNLGLVLDNVRQINNAGGSELIEQLVRVKKGDVLFAVSFPRYSKRIIQAVRFAKDNGAKVIALTDISSSPIASYSDILLTAKTDMAAFADSLVAPLSVINALIVAVTTREKDKLGETFGKLENIWNESNFYDSDI